MFISNLATVQTILSMFLSVPVSDFLDNLCEFLFQIKYLTPAKKFVKAVLLEKNALIQRESCLFVSLSLCVYCQFIHPSVAALCLEVVHITRWMGCIIKVNEIINVIFKLS